MAVGDDVITLVGEEGIAVGMVVRITVGEDVVISVFWLSSDEELVVHPVIKEKHKSKPITPHISTTRNGF